jgi:ubiquinone/menaquinone biosynthesis C-methylase UbiE
MLHRSQERAKALQVSALTPFLAADARHLPFPDNCFDVVLLESVIVFFEEKVEALKELARIIKPGGYLGFTEMTWLQTPTQDYVDLFMNAAFVTAHQEEGWKELLVKADFVNVTGKGSPIDPARESKGRFKRYGNSFVFKTIPRMIKLILTDKTSRSFFKDGTSGLSRDILTYVGYGVYAGRKP